MTWRTFDIAAVLAVVAAITLSGWAMRRRRGGATLVRDQTGRIRCSPDRWTWWFVLLVVLPWLVATLVVVGGLPPWVDLTVTGLAAVWLSVWCVISLHDLRRGKAELDRITAEALCTMHRDDPKEQP